MPMLAYSWTGAATDNIQPMVWAGNLHGNGEYRLSVGDFDDAADNTYDRLAAVSAGRRCLFLRHLGEQRSDIFDLDERTIDGFVRSGCAEEGWSDGMSLFWRTWKAKGSMRPDRIVVEYEGGKDWWQLGADSDQRAGVLHPVIADPTLSRLIPRALRVATLEQLESIVNASSTFARYVPAWTAFAMKRRAEAVTRVALSTYQDVMDAACPPISNYQDYRTRFDTFDSDGWRRIAQFAAVGTVSSPELYIQSSGQDRYNSLSKERRWNHFTDNMNLARAVVGELVPWISTPRWAGPAENPSTSRAGFGEQLKHLAALGVREVLYWNPVGLSSPQPAENEADRTFVDDLLESLTPATTPLRLGAIELDEDLVSTGSTVTVYDENDWV